MESHGPCIVFVGGGPRTAGMLERLAANVPEMTQRHLHIHVVDPFTPGSGRIWRFDQSPELLLNSMAGDVTMFTDASVNCAGPALDGPDLAQWAAALCAGTLADPPALPQHLWAQVAVLTRTSFPTRQLQSSYLEWFFRRAVAALLPHATVTIHRDTAVSIEPGSDGPHLVQLAGGTQLQADAVVLALGHTDATVHGQSADFADFAARHGNYHAAPAYTTDVDYTGLSAGQDVIVSGMGLAFIDLVILLTEGRGGRFVEQSDGELSYVPSGTEPRLWAGSRRGVPFHSKISARLRGTAPGPCRYFTTAAVQELLASHSELDFRTQLWPLMAKDAAWAYYQELFTGTPQRVSMTWPDFAELFDPLAWNTPELAALVRSAVPDSALRLDFEHLDKPLADTIFTDKVSVAKAVVSHIVQDLKVRDGNSNPETLALFLGFLRVYLEFASIVPAQKLTAASHATVHNWWHGFFSFVDSGPPPHRLRQLLALHKAGLVQFLGPGLKVETDEDTGQFLATAAGGASSIRANAFIEARLPAPTLQHTANPVLAQLQASGLACEQQLLTEDGIVSTGRLLINENHQLLTQRGEAMTSVFAVGPGTSAWGSGAFARPRSNAAPFRENDALARAVLRAVAPVIHSGASGLGAPHQSRQAVQGKVSS